jgi:hypothetical protein
MNTFWVGFICGIAGTGAVVFGFVVSYALAIWFEA